MQVEADNELNDCQCVVCRVRPKNCTLPCKHRYCKRCVLTMNYRAQQVSKELVCPECRTHYDVEAIFSLVYDN